jgi:hypothetical protein
MTQPEATHASMGTLSSAFAKMAVQKFNGTFVEKPYRKGGQKHDRFGCLA